MLFYGNNIYGASVLSYYIFAGLFIALFTCMITVLQVIKDYKMVFISLSVGVLIKLIFNNDFILSFYQVGLPPYYGVITATILGYLVSTIICMFTLYKKHNIKFKDSLNCFIEMMVGSIIMIIVLFIISLIIPIYSKVRIVNLFIILFYALVGAIIYFIYAYKSNLIRNIFGKNFITKIKNIILKK
jgi:peptidoglycan biosynthesis protein MviN/MurJ (putative lipid II flippase)